MNEKISIRFFNDHEVRAAWDDTNTRWLFLWFGLYGEKRTMQVVHRCLKNIANWSNTHQIIRMDNGQITLFQTLGGETKIEVQLANESVWHTADQMAELFQRDL